MEVNFAEVLKIAGLAGGWLIVIVIVLIVLTKPEGIFLWASKIQKLFLWTSSRVRKSQISNDIRGNILKVSKKLSEENSNILPYDLKIEWVQEQNKDTFMKNQQIIVRMTNNANPYINYITALSEYVKNGLIPKSRKYIDVKLLEAADLTIIRKLLCMSWDDAIDYFDSKICDPARVKDQDLGDFIDQLGSIDNNGMLVQVLLNEYNKIAKKIHPEAPNEKLKNESRELLHFLKDIAKRETGDHTTQLTFNKDYFKIKIVLAVTNQVYQKHGLNKYKGNIVTALNNGIESIYIFGLGSKKEMAKNLGDLVAQEDLRIKDVKYYQYKHSSRYGRCDGICAELKLWSSDDTMVVQ